jgi:DNA-binding CsgD family transcriptional regulator
MPGKLVAVQPPIKAAVAPRHKLPQSATDASRARTGFLVTSATLDLLYANAAAFRILSFPGDSHEPAVVERQLRSIFPAERIVAEPPAEASFVSGRRTYVCRPFLLQAPHSRPRQATLGVLLERPFHGDRKLDVRSRFHLSPREFESVQYLVRGLTTKEVAERMKVSPNTVKQYVRLVMSKMGVTTRAGIVGKLLTG